MKTVGRMLLWVVFNGIIAAGVWYGGYRGVEWAANMVVFYTWAVLMLWFIAGPLMVMTGVVVASGEDLPEYDPREKWHAPPEVDIPVDLLMALGMAGAGWIATAIAFVMKSIIGHFCLGVWQSGYERAQETEKETQGV